MFGMLQFPRFLYFPSKPTIPYISPPTQPADFHTHPTNPIPLQKMSTQIESALSTALRKLVSQISRNGELPNFSFALAKRKQYDQCEREYVEDQRLRKELGNEYESSDSEEEKENHFNKMSHRELQKMMRKNLIDRNFDPDVLLPIPDPQQHEQENDDLTTVRFLAEDAESAHHLKNPTTELNIIQEARELVEEDVERQTNFGLEFLIQELERIQKGTAMKG